MIGVKEAITKIIANAKLGKVTTVPILEALNCTLAEDILSPINMPPFDQSAMDGYALSLTNTNEYELIGEIKAGDISEYNLKPGQAIRIFTGGMVPEGANCVAKQEIVHAQGDKIQLQEKVREQMNIRPLGEQITQGALAFEKGTILTAGAVGYLATLGMQTVKVLQRPKITIIATGNELVQPGQHLPKGKIYESNSTMLLAALRTSGFDAEFFTVEDNYDSTKSLIEDTINSNEVVILTGGISVGDYDFVGKALDEIGVENIFYKVKQKPGKPVYFGKTPSTLIFALPGNPAAALSCFYVYVLTALRLHMGYKKPQLDQLELSISQPYSKPSNLTHFLKAKFEGSSVQILGAQSSAMLSSFTDANCLLIMEEGKENWAQGEKVTAILLP